MTVSDFCSCFEKLRVMKYCNPLTTQAYRQQHCIKGLVLLVIQAQNDRVKVHVKTGILWWPAWLQSDRKTSGHIRLYRTYM